MRGGFRPSHPNQTQAESATDRAAQEEKVETQIGLEASPDTSRFSYRKRFIIRK